MGFELTPAQVTTIDLAIKSIADIFNNLAMINLTTEERTAARSVAEGRQPFIDKTYETLAPANPTLHPGYMSFADNLTNYNYSNQTAKIIIALRQLLEIAEDHNFSADNLNFKWLLKFYNNAQEARDTNTPGADSVVAELAPLFAQTNTAVPTPPPTDG